VSSCSAPRLLAIGRHETQQAAQQRCEPRKTEH
jgi:hypothetical protein